MPKYVYISLYLTLCQENIVIDYYLWRKKLQPLYKNHAPLYHILFISAYGADKETTVFQRGSQVQNILPAYTTTIQKIVRVFCTF